MNKLLKDYTEVEEIVDNGFQSQVSAKLSSCNGLVDNQIRINKNTVKLDMHKRNQKRRVIRKMKKIEEMKSIGGCLLVKFKENSYLYDNSRTLNYGLNFHKELVREQVRQMKLEMEENEQRRQQREQKEEQEENPRVKLFEDDSVKSLGEMFNDHQTTITHNQHSKSPSMHKTPHKLFYKEEITKNDFTYFPKFTAIDPKIRDVKFYKTTVIPKVRNEKPTTCEKYQNRLKLFKSKKNVKAQQKANLSREKTSAEVHKKKKDRLSLSKPKFTENFANPTYLAPEKGLIGTIRHRDTVKGRNKPKEKAKSFIENPKDRIDRKCSRFTHGFNLEVDVDVKSPENLDRFEPWNELKSETLDNSTNANTQRKIRCMINYSRDTSRRPLFSQFNKSPEFYSPEIKTIPKYGTFCTRTVGECIKQKLEKRHLDKRMSLVSNTKTSRRRNYTVIDRLLTTSEYFLECLSKDKNIRV
ncbi:unnamed protein product [Moneuplotes crassus]|uniref:Uncharacterized protein n=1 Tax=Euplotes crassus TaxID=5936 RepID=A0AAD1Y8A4_EUPCR|nr:unnamed protein product [Moneuplotes crassus]